MAAGRHNCCSVAVMRAAAADNEMGVCHQYLLTAARMQILVIEFGPVRRKLSRNSLEILILRDHI